MNINKKISNNIEKEKYDFLSNSFIYNYKFRTNQDLEQIDNFEYFGIDYDSMKRKVIENLIDEFRIQLNIAIFGVESENFKKWV